MPYTCACSYWELAPLAFVDWQNSAVNGSSILVKSIWQLYSVRALSQRALQCQGSVTESPTVSGLCHREPYSVRALSQRALQCQGSVAESPTVSGLCHREPYSVRALSQRALQCQGSVAESPTVSELCHREPCSTQRCRNRDMTLTQIPILPSRNLLVITKARLQL